jgi:broad specificity phosphatase PhoE
VRLVGTDVPTLYLIRHAEPAITGVLLGQADPPLSEEGRRNAQLLRLPEPCTVYTSPLRRAKETAAFLAPEAIVVPELAEITYGDWDGLAWQEIEQCWPELAAEKLRDWTAVTPPNGESFANFSARVSRAFAQISNAGEPAAVVAHEAVNAIIVFLLFKDSAFISYRQSYCEIRQYDLSTESGA